MATPTQTFGQWLKAERERTNLTPTALARAAGVTPQYIHNLEKDVPTKSGAMAQPSSEVCIRLANALGVHYLEVLRKAGHVPADIPEAEIRARMGADYIASLPDERQEEAVAYLKFMFENYGDKSKMRGRSPKHAGVIREGESHPDPVAEAPPQPDKPPLSSRTRDGKNTDSERTAKNGSEK